MLEVEDLEQGDQAGGYGDIGLALTQRACGRGANREAAFRGAPTGREVARRYCGILSALTP